MRVPWPNPGFMRRVYPGFLQLSGFLAMNIDRHVDAHVHQFRNLVRGDGDGAEQHRVFYDEYLAVMDLPAEFYLQTIERVFQKRLMATGAYRYRDRPVEPAAITDIALMTVEGEKDDITGLGQTEAAHDIVRLPDDRRRHFVAQGRRPLRRLQRLALAQHDPARGPRLHPGQRGTLRTAPWPTPSASATRRSRSRLRRNARARRMVLRVSASAGAARP